VKVLLVSPTQALALESEAGGPVEDGTGHYPPLGLLYLQAALEAAGPHEVDVLDANLPGGLEDGLADHCRDESPALVGVTALTPNLPSVVHTIAALRRAFPDARVVVGGPHADVFPEETARLEGVDFVLTGEGEHTLPLLVKQLEDGAPEPEVAGLFTRDGASQGSPKDAGVVDVDDLPTPDRSRTDVRAYRGIGGRDDVFTTMVTSRGCPHRCTFCSTPRGRYRMRSVASIVEEIERCASLGIEHVYFLDDTFPTTGRRARELFEVLAGRDRLPTWSCRTTAGGLTEETLPLMKRAGCRRVQVGVETSTDEGLNLLGKSTSIAEIRQTFSAARKVGMPTVAYFMLGLPNERNADDVRRLMRFARELRPTFAMFNVLTLYPGTALLAQAVDRGIVAADPWRSFARDPDRGFLPPVWDEHLTREQLSALQDEAYRSFYLRPGVVLRMALTGGGLGRKVRAGVRLLFAPRGRSHSDRP